MRLSFSFITANEETIAEISYEVEAIPRIGEHVLTAPGITPEGTPEVEMPGVRGLFEVVRVSYLLDNHGRLGYPTITLKHVGKSPKEVSFSY
jgi:hypothetical protein